MGNVIFISILGWPENSTLLQTTVHLIFGLVFFRTHEDKAPYNLYFRYDPSQQPDQGGVLLKDKKQLQQGIIGHLGLNNKRSDNVNATSETVVLDN